MLQKCKINIRRVYFECCRSKNVKMKRTIAVLVLISSIAFAFAAGEFIRFNNV